MACQARVATLGPNDRAAPDQVELRRNEENKP